MWQRFNLRDEPEMGMRAIIALLLALIISMPALPVLTQVAMAQEGEAGTGDMPPLPRPRPDPSTLPPRTGANGAAATDAIEAVTTVPQPVTLTARITADGAPITEGVVWRVFDTEGEGADMALVAKSETATANIELPPGNYYVHLAYGHAQLREPLAVNPGPNAQEFVMEAGALRLNSSVTGDIAIPATLLTFDIFTGGESERNLIAEGLAANEIITLNAGVYHIESHFGSINAVVRADLRVEPGQLTDATLFHHAAQVSFRLVSEEGGEAIADVEWTVKTAEGETIFTDLGAFPSTVLAEGDYLILAKQGEQVFNREFQVQPGAPVDIEVLTTVYSEPVVAAPVT
jgi:hypothetical protein